MSTNRNRNLFKTSRQYYRAKHLADALHTLIQIEYMLKPEYRVEIVKYPSCIHFEIYPHDSINTLYHACIVTKKRTRLSICKQIDTMRKELYKQGFIADKDLRGLRWIWY